MEVAALPPSERQWEANKEASQSLKAGKVIAVQTSQPIKEFGEAADGLEAGTSQQVSKL